MMQFINKTQGNPKSVKSVLFCTGLCPNFSEYLNYFLDFNDDFEYLMHVGEILKWGMREAVAPLTHKYILIFKF